VSRALSWLDAPRSKPFFLYVHFMDAHDPYAPPAPYLTMYGDASRSKFEMSTGTLASIMDGRTRISRDDLARMEDLYDGAVTYIDDQVGRLMEELRRRDLLSRTLVVFTADHGEEFLDHGDLEHTRTLYEEITRIPLVIAGPGVKAGQVLPGPARQVDVAPSILAAAGLEFPGHVDGASLWRALSGGEPAEAKDAFMELAYPGFRSPWHTVVALRRGGLKLVGTSINPGRTGPWTWSLYDLRSDPGERSDASDAHAAEGSAMRESLQAWSRRPEATRAPGEAYDEETERRLRALGYID
jgi:arylsulfatase A-like enzyme